jgi:hypothetical protein
MAGANETLSELVVEMSSRGSKSGGSVVDEGGRGSGGIRSGKSSSASSWMEGEGSKSSRTSLTRIGGWEPGGVAEGDSSGEDAGGVTPLGCVVSGGRLDKRRFTCRLDENPVW